MDENEKIILTKEFSKAFLQLRKTFVSGPCSENIKRNEFILLMLITDRVSSDIKGVKVSDLSTILDITPAAVTHMINSLEKKEYLERLSDKSDRRIVLVRPTNAGNIAIESMKKQFFSDIKELLSFLGEKDSKELIRLLSLVNDFNVNKKNKNK